MRAILIMGGILMLFHAIHQQPIDLEWVICGAAWWMMALCWK